ncbi:hypothetical protein CPB84DRAFT_848669 [Gymnopilus junonius]|uniref:Uncharacterized protein n=1 Tax=Gymnopilus junonius TaxID=109634 RepID=A0A9P5NMZ6_GYMJU|nr:hypothetical protein CPB84DRAFT_848669 [Gymnopilus junonius]
MVGGDFEPASCLRNLSLVVWTVRDGLVRIDLYGTLFPPCGDFFTPEITYVPTYPLYPAIVIVLECCHLAGHCCIIVRIPYIFCCCKCSTMNSGKENLLMPSGFQIRHSPIWSSVNSSSYGHVRLQTFTENVAFTFFFFMQAQTKILASGYLLIMHAARTRQAGAKRSEHLANLSLFTPSSLEPFLCSASELFVG